MNFKLCVLCVSAVNVSTEMPGWALVQREHGRQIGERMSHGRRIARYFIMLTTIAMTAITAAPNRTAAAIFQPLHGRSPSTSPVRAFTRI